MNQIIFINRFFYPDQSATSQILTDLLFNIHDKVNAEFHVVTSRNTYQGGERLSNFEVIRGVHVHRVWTSNFGRKTLPGRAIDYLTFYISTFFQLLLMVRRGDVVIAKTDPPVISIVAWIAAKLKGASLINWIQDLFPEVACALGIIKADTILYRILKRIKNISVNAAVCNVVIGECMKERLISEGTDADKITVVHNWNINQNECYVEKHNNPLVKEWGLQDKFVIGYSGNFGRAHEYEPIRKLIEYFSDESNVVFLFIGGGKYYDDLKMYVAKAGIRNVMFKPYQDKSQLSYSLSAANVHLISLAPALEGLIVPSKFYGLAAIGSIVIFIGDEQGEIGKLLCESNSGYVFSPEAVEKLSNQIDEMLLGKCNELNISKNILDLYKNKFKPVIAYNAWMDIIKKALL